MGGNTNRKIITRIEAFKAGHDKFYTGKQCANGHKGQRYTSSKKCVNCTTDIPVITEHLHNMAAAAALIQGIHHDTIPTIATCNLIGNNSFILLDNK